MLFNNVKDFREVERCFMVWVRAVKRDKEREVADYKSDAVDGKTVRGSFNTQQGSKAIHLVSAWATENRLVFARIKSGNGPENLAFIRKIALSSARSDTDSKRSIAGRIKREVPRLFLKNF
jgi:predicted transposase YbfD/YdcC